MSAAEQALVDLGRGFLEHEDNQALRAALDGGSPAATGYFQELIRAVYRLIFLIVVEEREVLHPAGATATARALYADGYGVRRLVDLAARPSADDGPGDLWEGVKIVFRGLDRGEERLGLPALGGLFAAEQCPHLDASKLGDRALLAAVLRLSSSARPEELGSIHEGLLERVPRVAQGARAFELVALGKTKENARKRSGGYYTPDRLVQALLDGALEPVVNRTIAASPERAAGALLDLAILDPACGSGYFLLAAARRLAGHVARLRAGGTPSHEEVRRAVGEVVGRCMYGVDLNPMAVELCRVSLWLEAALPGKIGPFVESHVQHGNALFGATPDLLRAGMPDEAWEPVELGKKVHFLRWPQAFPEVFARGGFDVVLGNPPWIAHAGRAAQPIEPRLRAFYQRSYASFADYPTTHGMFVSLSAQVLREEGRMGLLIPSSVSELGSYEPTRRAHDRLCDFPGELVDFGEGQFPGVTQPCMALISCRRRGGRTDAAPGAPWPVERPDLDATARRLLHRLGGLPRLPEALFGERGVQSDRKLREHFFTTPKPVARFTTPIREGTDVREFQLLPPRVHVDGKALGPRMRSAEEFRAVRIVVRQTARYPIAAIGDGGAFRNSLLAAYGTEAWPPEALVVLLNSALVRFLHYMRFRDARQPIMPQVKIGHLRAIPGPVDVSAERMVRLRAIGERLSQENRRPGAGDRREIDALVGDLYSLDAEERRAVAAWHDALAPRA